MTTYVNTFGGQTLPPSEYQFRAFNLTADVALYWPDNTDGTDLVATLMNVTPSGGAWTITLPPANEVSTGRDFLIRNLGAASFDVVDNAAGALATIAAGESRYFYITDNSTAAGTWSVFTYGTGSSSADASALAGYGLTVLSGTLNSDLPITSYGAGVTIAATDRASFLVYQGGSTTWYLPDPSTLANGFFCAVNNAGTGTLTIDANTAGGFIDEANTKQLQPNESCFIVSKGDATGYFTIGYGRSTEFAFTQLAVDVSSGGTATITITSAQATNKLWYFYNTAAGDRNVSIPAVASVYFVRVGAIGAGNDLTFTTGSGSTVSLSANQSYTIYCDGTNVVSAQTVAVTSTVALDDGSAAAPSLNFSLDTDTGLYRSTTNVLGIAAAGAMVATFGTAGVTLATALSVANGGTGATTLTGIVKGNGTSAFTAASAGTDYVAPGGALGTPSSGTLTNCTGLPVSTGISGLGANVATMLATPTKANFDSALSDDNFAYLGTVQTFTKAQLVHPDSDVAGLTVRGGAGGTANAFQVQDNGSNPLLTVSGTGVLTANLASATGLPLTTGVTGVLPVANGGTNSTTFDTNLLSGKMYAAATGTDTYAVTLSPAPAAYVEGLTVFFKAANANTGASTLNVNGLGALAIQNPDGSALAAGVIVAGGVYMATYDGTQFKLNRGPTGATGATGPAGASTTYTVSTQTAVGAASGESFTIAYTVGYIDVYQNGARLIPTTDYTANNGTSVVMAGLTTAGDDITFVVWSSVGLANFTGAVFNDCTIGLTTPAAGKFTTLTSTGNATLGDAEASDTHAIKGATTLLANSASAALTVTQTGSGNAFVVEDSTSPDSTPFVVTADGLVGVGVSSPQAGLHVSGIITQQRDTSTNQYLMSAGGTFNRVWQRRASGSNASPTIVASGDALGDILWSGHDGSGYIQTASIQCSVDGTPGTNDMPGRIIISTTADGASSPTEALRINSIQSVIPAKLLDLSTSTAGQIKFPATQNASADANTLDDYEEGTWTPTQGAGLTVVGAFSSSGTYTKIGRKVTVIGVISGATSVAASSGGVMVGGLPFNAGSYCEGTATNGAATAGSVLFVDTGASVYSVSAIAATASIRFGATYFV